jgi:hypothetical protein
VYRWAPTFKTYGSVWCMRSKAWLAARQFFLHTRTLRMIMFCRISTLMLCVFCVQSDPDTSDPSDGEGDAAAAAAPELDMDAEFASFMSEVRCM